MHPDRAVAAVIDHDRQKIAAGLRRARQFLTVHQEIAIARHGDHGPLRKTLRRRDRRGHAIPHRAAGRRELAGIALVTPVAVPPAGEIARTIADDRVGGQRVAHELHAGREIERVGVARCRCGPLGPFLVRLCTRVEWQRILARP